MSCCPNSPSDPNGRLTEHERLLAVSLLGTPRFGAVMHYEHGDGISVDPTTPCAREDDDGGAQD